MREHDMSDDENISQVACSWMLDLKAKEKKRFCYVLANSDGSLSQYQGRIDKMLRAKEFRKYRLLFDNGDIEVHWAHDVITDFLFGTFEFDEEDNV